jgi:peroxiredoxin
MRVTSNDTPARNKISPGMEVMMAELNVGDKAPDFTLPSTIGDQWSLSSVKGQKSVLVSVHVFDFTGDDTRGCVCQMSTLKAEYDRIKEADGEVVEVSADSIFSHRRWLQDLGGSDFPMLADFNKEMLRSWGILDEQTGRPVRSVFVIDKDGVVRHKNTSFNASEPAQYEAAIKALEAAK